MKINIFIVTPILPRLFYFGFQVSLFYFRSGKICLKKIERILSEKIVKFVSLSTPIYMQRKNHIFTFFILLLCSCSTDKKEYVEPSQAMFWTDHDLGCGPITVTCNNTTQSVTGSYPELPDCGAPKAATFNLPPGVYTYQAACSTKTWQGSITVIDAACTSLQLK